MGPNAFAEFRRQNLAEQDRLEIQARQDLANAQEREAAQVQWEYENRSAPCATPSEAHAEWHLNAGVPMGVPGCPQDACHPIEDPEEYEPVVKGVRCGNVRVHGRGGETIYHPGSAGVRACYQNRPGAALDQVTPEGYPVGTVVETPQAAEPEPVQESLPEISVEEAVATMRKNSNAERYARWATIPVENDDYASYALAVDGGVKFYKVRRPSYGKWEGRTFVDLMVSDETRRMPWAESAEVLDRIAEDPQAAAILYGKETKRCAICHRKLTKKESRERGIGPVCFKRMGG